MQQKQLLEIQRLLEKQRQVNSNSPEYWDLTRQIQQYIWELRYGKQAAEQMIAQWMEDCENAGLCTFYTKS